MSPDPPREESSDNDNNRIRRFSGELEGIMDDQDFFIVPDQPYELDMQDESDWTDSDEEDNNASSSARVPGSRDAAAGGGDPEHVVVEGQWRGRYRLLIPFPVATNEATENSSVIAEGDTSQSSQIAENTTFEGTEGCSVNASESQSSESTPTTSSDKASSSKSNSAEQTKREIEMTEEKVETIMQVMKNITLPSTAIPKWASDVDEDIWKKKIYDSISTRTSKGHSSRSTNNSTGLHKD